MAVNLVYPELSYKLVGLAYKTFNDLGYGYPEKYYQLAYEENLKREKINFEREKFISLQYLDKKIGKYFLDFIVEGKIVVELKIRAKIGYTDIKQVVGYLRATGCQLAILIYLTRDGVKYRRVVNLN